MSESILTIKTVDALEVHLPRAGIGTRAYAFLIDWHIRALAAATWFFLALYFLGLGIRESIEPLAYLATIPASAIYFLYHPVLEVLMQGQTPGKRWIHVRVVSSDGSPAGVGALLVRNLFRLLDSLPALYALGLLVMLVTREQVRIGDLAAGTVVVYDAPHSDEGLRGAVIHERVPPRVAQLLEEWLERWRDMEPQQRDAIARTLLQRAPDPKIAAGAAGLASEDLRGYVRRVLDEAGRTA